MSELPQTTVSVLTADQLADRIGELTELLHTCVHDGASINFIMPFPVAEAEAFWRNKVLPPAREGMRFVLVAERNSELAGTVQLGIDTPPNQPHRAEIVKLVVHPRFRRRGVARALMVAAEDLARAQGRSLITLDTRTGDDAEPLYLSLGYVAMGVIPDYSRDVFTDAWDAATFMYKSL